MSKLDDIRVLEEYDKSQKKKLTLPNMYEEKRMV